jgi:hypothetical protein
MGGRGRINPPSGTIFHTDHNESQRVTFCPYSFDAHGDLWWIMIVSYHVQSPGRPILIGDHSQPDTTCAHRPILPPYIQGSQLDPRDPDSSIPIEESINRRP